MFLSNKRTWKWTWIFWQWGKIIVKRATQVSGLIVWIVIIFFGIFSINYKVYMLKAWHKLKMFLHVQSTQTLKMDNSCFFQTFLFLPNIYHSFWKLERILTLMIKRAKGLELMKIVLITHLNTFGPKVFLTLKIMDFENVAWTKVVHIYVIKGMNVFISKIKC